jgi:hypothetical protein
MKRLSALIRDDKDAVDEDYDSHIPKPGKAYLSTVSTICIVMLLSFATHAWYAAVSGKFRTPKNFSKFFSLKSNG